jgi:hypothetical protein
MGENGENFFSSAARMADVYGDGSDTKEEEEETNSSGGGFGGVVGRYSEARCNLFSFHALGFRSYT